MKSKIVATTLLFLFMCAVTLGLRAPWTQAPPPRSERWQDRAPVEFVASVYDDDRRASQWASVRKLHLKREPFCAWCGGTENLQVHHIHPFALNPELHGSRAPGGELDDGTDGTGRDGNLITLCMIPRDKARTPEEADHHERYGHGGHFHGGENLNVRAECTAHEKQLKAKGQWPNN